MLDHEKGSIIVAIDALTRALAFDNVEHGVKLAQTQLAAIFDPPPVRHVAPARDEQRDAVTIVLWHPTTIDDRPDVDDETGRELWRDALTHEVEALAERHGKLEYEVHYEDMLERESGFTYPDQWGADRVNESGPGNES